MNANRTPQQLTRYLQTLEASLADAPTSARHEILADVQAHADDALEQGRTIDKVLAALGPVQEHAAQYRSELGLPAEPPIDSRRASTILHGAAVILGILTGCFVAFLMLFSGSPFEPPRSHVNDLMMKTLVGLHGLGLALFAFIPALLAVLSLVLPQKARMPVAVANAGSSRQSRSPRSACSMCRLRC